MITPQNAVPLHYAEARGSGPRPHGHRHPSPPACAPAAGQAPCPPRTRTEWTPVLLCLRRTQPPLHIHPRHTSAAIRGRTNHVILPSGTPLCANRGARNCFEDKKREGKHSAFPSRCAALHADGYFSMTITPMSVLVAMTSLPSPPSYTTIIVLPLPMLTRSPAGQFANSP